MKKIGLSICCFLLSGFCCFSQNTWQTKAPLPASGYASKRAGSDVFGIGNYGYVFGGKDSLFMAHSDLWRYDPLSDQWTQMASLPGSARYSSVTSVIGIEAYVGTGFDGSICYNDWWEYNSFTNTWTRKADFPGAVRANALSFSVNGKVYVGLGKDFTSYDDWYQYDPLTDSWAVKASYPGGPMINGLAFSIGNYGYVGLGSVINPYPVKSMYKYDPAGNSWSQLTDFPDINGVYAVGCFTIGDKAFVCGGYDYSSLHDNCFEYNASNDTWSSIASFSNVSPARLFRGGFAVGGKGYLFGGSTNFQNNSTGFRNDLIEYTSNYVGVEDVTDDNNISVVYENASHNLIITVKSITVDTRVILYNGAGQLIDRYNIKGNSGLIKTLELPSGIYFYSIEAKSCSIKQGKFLVN